MEKVTEDQWVEWKINPVTLALRQFLAQARQGLMEQWAGRAFQGKTRDEVLTLNAAALGELLAYERVMDLELDQLQDTIKDD